jgi:hypothetical protein
MVRMLCCTSFRNIHCDALLASHDEYRSAGFYAHDASAQRTDRGGFNDSLSVVLSLACLQPRASPAEENRQLFELKAAGSGADFLAFVSTASTTRLSNSIPGPALITGSCDTPSTGSYQGDFSIAPPSRALAINCPISIPLSGTRLPSSFL